jgi:hypothetical protein
MPKVQRSARISTVSFGGPLEFVELSKALNRCELELLHNWITTTSLTIGLNRGPERTRIWQMVVPQIAQSNRFLLHSIIAVSAAHIFTCGRQSSESNCGYRHIALYHHVHAISDFRKACGSKRVHPPSEQASLPFGILTMFTALARLPGTCGPKPNSSSYTVDLESFFHGLVFVRHSIGVAMLLQKRGPGTHKTAGLVAHLHGTVDGTRKDLTAVAGLHPPLLASLDRLISLVATSSSLSPEEAETLFLAIKKTRLWFQLVPLRPQNHSYLLMWVGSMTIDFLSLVQSKNPLALSLTAHWLVPMCHAPHLWFVSEFSRCAIRAIADEIVAAGVTDGIKWVLREVEVLH